jgi:hypothetical protein
MLIIWVFHLETCRQKLVTPSVATFMANQAPSDGFPLIYKLSRGKKKWTYYLIKMLYNVKVYED